MKLRRGDSSKIRNRVVAKAIMWRSITFCVTEGIRAVQ